MLWEEGVADTNGVSEGRRKGHHPGRSSSTKVLLDKRTLTLLGRGARSRDLNGGRGVQVLRVGSGDRACPS